MGYLLLNKHLLVISKEGIKELLHLNINIKVLLA